jgi:Tfp pilus assembly protein PilF
MNHDPLQEQSSTHASVWLIGSVVVALGGGFLAGWIHRHGVLEREATRERARQTEVADQERRDARIAAARSCASALDDAWAWKLRRRHAPLLTRALARAAGVADASDPTRTKGEVVKEAVERLHELVAGLPPLPELAAELDDWALLEREQRDVDAAAPLLELARALDPEARRTELRGLFAASNGGRLRELAAAPTAPGDPPATLALLLKALAGAGLSDVAIRLGERGVATHPDDYSLRILLADLEFERGPPAAATARGHYEVALALRPTAGRAWAHLGWLLADQAGDPNAAATLMEVATRRIPNEPVAAALLYVHGVTSARARHFAEARQTFAHALDLDPRCALARAGIGDTFIDRGEYQDLVIAPPSTEVEDSTTPPDPARSEQAWSSLLDQAREAYEESLRLFDTAEARDGLAAVHWTQGDLQLAGEELDEAVRRHPDDATLRSHLAASLMQRGASSEAMAQLREAVRLDEWNAGAQNDYAWELANSGDLHVRRPGQALEHARRACELESGNAWYRNTLGVALYRTGDYEQCVAELTAASELPRGGGPFDHYFLAMALHQLGDEAAARDHYSQGVQQTNEGDAELERARTEAFTVLGLERGDK